MSDFPCVVIRGICDYSDSHKNDAWQGYAAATAAVFAREVLYILRPQIPSSDEPLEEPRDAHGPESFCQ